MIKFNLGCGADYKEGWVNIDNDPTCRTDLFCNILDFKYDTNTVDEILISHVAMYIKPDEMSKLLERCYSWLVRDGKITIETIDLEKVMEEAGNVLSDKNESWGLVNIFGTNKTGTHRWGWTIDNLQKQMLNAGFKEIKYSKGLKKPDRDFMLIAIK